jgi:hypothetical protein
MSICTRFKRKYSVNPWAGEDSEGGLGTRGGGHAGVVPGAQGTADLKS